MRGSIPALCVFCTFLRRHGESIPGVRGCGRGSFSCLPSDAGIFAQAMCPVPRRRIHHRFNASETFTTNRLIRDALTFFIFGAPVGWNRFHFFTRGNVDDGTVEPARAEKGKEVKFLCWFSQTLCPGVGNAVGAGLPSAISARGPPKRLCMRPGAGSTQHPAQLHLQSKINGIKTNKKAWFARSSLGVLPLPLQSG